MLPVGTLMIEHRLIERAIKLISDEISVMKEKRTADPEFIRIIIDFIKTYADKLHHGKEEDILFRDLALKNLSHEHAKIMEELIQEHILGRTITNDLVKARKDYIGGNEAAINKIIEKMDFLVRFYPKHIEKEDKHFFLPVY
jgi:hemerythrin-like domain-containing protein